MLYIDLGQDGDNFCLFFYRAIKTKNRGHVNKTRDKDFLFVVE